MDHVWEHSDELIKKQNEKSLQINQLREKFVSENITFEEIVEYPTKAAIKCFKFPVRKGDRYVYLWLQNSGTLWLCDSDKEHESSHIICCSHERAINMNWDNQLTAFPLKMR